MPKHLVSLSLPKTGTTYVRGLLSKLDNCDVGAIKEPTFFCERENGDGPILRKVIANGNSDKGLDWYRSIFGQDDFLVDMSTQYWLDAEQVVKKVCEANIGDPVFINIRRNPKSQLCSYLAHLRRGYIPDKDIRALVNEDGKFLSYLEEMAGWNASFEKLKEKFPNATFLTLDFSKLHKSPSDVLVELLKGIDIINELPGTVSLQDVSRNKMSAPVLGWINSVLFSRFFRALGRRLPQFIYLKLIAMRKKVIKLNLKEGKSRFFEDDCLFVEELVSTL